MNMTMHRPHRLHRLYRARAALEQAIASADVFATSRTAEALVAEDDQDAGGQRSGPSQAKSSRGKMGRRTWR
jgi:hypothetical protein